ncbi:MAG: hypothetical protein ACLUF9_00615 [Oscillospiraceae bacterium]
MKKILITAFVVMIVFVSSAVPVFAAAEDPTTGNGFTVVGTPHFVPYSGEVDSASGLAAILAQLTTPNQALDYLSAYNSSDYSVFFPNYVVNIKYNASLGVYGIYLEDSAHSGWLHTGSRASGRYMIYCPDNKFEPNLLYSISRSASFISSTVSTISGTLTDKLSSMESSLTRLLSRTLKTDQAGTQYTLAELVYNLWQKVDRLYDRTLKTVGSSQYTISDLQYNTWQQTERTASRLLKTVDNAQYTVADLQYNTWQQTERTASRLLKTVDNAQYTVADLQYNTWQQAKNALTKLGSIDTRLSTLHTDASSLGGKLDNIAELLKTTSYTCGYKSNASGTAYPTQTIPYNMAVQIAARINSEMLGKQMTVIKQDGSGTTTATISRCLVDSSGYIIARSASAAYYLCGKDNTIFVASQDYVKSIYSRMTDVISAVNNLTVGVDLSDVHLSVDASSINLFNNTAYCCGYQTDADGNLYPTLPIPFDSAAAILERLNTDYVDKKITVFSRSGAASSGYLRSASITSDGYIRIALTNGYTYFLCDNTNVLYLVDASSNYGSRANDALTGISSQLVSTQTSIESALSTIIDKMDNLPASVDNIVVNITKDNDAYNVFYVEDENGDKKSVTSVAGDSLSASGKLLQFLYKLIIGSAISDVDSSINGLNDFYFDNAPSGLGEGVTVWD